MSQLEIDDQEWAKPDNWRGGLFHYSRRDSRSFVPKRNSAMGITINFARPTGVLFLVGALGFAALLIHLARNG